MYLLGHNAHCLLIQTPAVPADPDLGIAGSDAVTRWQGDVQAHIDEDLVDVIKGNQRVTVSQTIVDLPVNIPIWPNPEDLLTLVRDDVLLTYSLAQPQTEIMKVRMIDGGFIFLGKLRMKVVRA